MIDPCTWMTPSRRKVSNPPEELGVDCTKPAIDIAMSGHQAPNFVTAVLMP